MELRDLRYFCLTAEMEHVTRAAEKLGIAQPSLTRIIRQIEEEVGGELFEKTGRRIRLNSSGEVFYKYAKKVLDDADILLTEMDYIFDRKEQNITLLCNTESFATRLITAFRDTNPNYSISVLYATQQEMIDALNMGEADFALCCPPITGGKESNIMTEVAFYEKGLIIFPPGHPLLNKSEIILDDLREETLVTMPKNSGMRNRLDSIFGANNLRPRIICETNNQNMILQAVSSGLGYAFVTKLMMEGRPDLMEYCVDVKVEDNIGFFGLSYSKYALDNRNAAHFREFTIDFLHNLQKEIYGPNALEVLDTYSWNE